jgi:hypothetical protein
MASELHERNGKQREREGREDMNQKRKERNMEG